MSSTIQSLWIGPELSVMEQLSVASFLSNGLDYHLYVYSEVKNIPSGVVVKDGNEILPDSMIFQYKEFKSYSGFSNFFRYKLLLERGGWWIDTDLVCLKPFDFSRDHIFSSELVKGAQVTNSGAIKSPAGSPVMEYCWDVCRKSTVEDLKWGATGPKLIAEAVRKFSLESCVMPYHYFCPLSYNDWHKVLDPDCSDEISESAYGIHLWNEMWRRSHQDKDRSYDPGCLYERLKSRFLNKNE